MFLMFLASTLSLLKHKLLRKLMRIKVLEARKANGAHWDGTSSERYTPAWIALHPQDQRRDKR